MDTTQLTIDDVVATPGWDETLPEDPVKLFDQVELFHKNAHERVVVPAQQKQAKREKATIVKEAQKHPARE